MDPVTPVLLKEAVAWSHSSNYQNTHVGAVIWNPKDNISQFAGASNNVTPEGDHSHAEVSAICNAARKGIVTQGANMYCTWASCPTCALAIIDAGIKQVHTLAAGQSRTPPRWSDSVEHGLELLKEHNVQVFKHDLVIGTVLRMDGEWFSV